MIPLSFFGIGLVFGFWGGVIYGGILRGDRRRSFRKAKELGRAGV